MTARTHRLVLAGSMASGLVALAVTAAILWPSATVSQESPAAELGSREKALQDAALRDLVQNAKVATLKGDHVTRDAMLTGLRRNARRARELVATTLAKSTDDRDRDVLAGLLKELNQ